MEPNDFVIATRLINGIVINSVGIIKSICEEGVQVYFIGKNEVVIVPFDAVSVIDVGQTGEKYCFKICGDCHIYKPITEFNKDTKKKRYRNCKSCGKVKDMSAAEQSRMDAKKPQIKTFFKCPICKRGTIVDVTARIVPDHDHRTGMGREWICQACNTGLGVFKEDITILKNAIEYLKRFENDEPEDSDSQ